MKLFFLVLVLVAALLVACAGLSTTSSAAPGSLVAQQSTSADAITGKPSLSADFVDQVLASARSPMQGTGALFVELSRQYGIDDAYTLAIFHHESNYGRTGEARASRSPGNLRCLDQAHYGDLATWCRDNYAWFPSWSSGLVAMYRLLAGPLYVAGGLTTIERIIERWAPDSDGNDSAAYIAAIRADVAAWRSEV